MRHGNSGRDRGALEVILYTSNLVRWDPTDGWNCTVHDPSTGSSVLFSDHSVDGEPHGGYVYRPV